MRREPPVDERDTDSERGPREPQEEPPKEQAPERAAQEPDEDHRHDQDQHQDGKYDPAAQTVRDQTQGMRNREPRITGVAITTLIWKLDSSYSS